MGFYFASNPLTAAIYAHGNSIIVADVVLGNINRNIVEIQPLKESAPEGYDSVLIAPTYMNQTNNNSSTKDNNSFSDHSDFHSQEFIIFDAARALPLGWVNFSAVDEQ